MHFAQRNIRLLYAFWFLREFQLWIPVWVVFLTIQRGFSLTEILFAEGVYLVGIVLLEVPTGAVADKWGRSRSLAMGAIVLAGALVIFATSSNFGVLLGSYLLWSLAHTLMSGADLALLFDTLKAAGDDARYERIAGRGVALIWAGVGVATLLGGPLSEFVPIEAIVYIGAATCAVSAVVCLLMKEAPHADAESAKPVRFLTGIAGSFRHVWRSPVLRPGILLSGITYAGMGAVSYLVQPYLLDRGIQVGTLFSLLQVPMFAAGIGGALLASRLATPGSTARALVVLPALGFVACLALAGAPGLTAYLAIPALMALVSAGEPVTSGIINRAVSSEQRATILSISGMTQSLVMAVAVPGVGYLTDGHGLETAFLASGLIVAGALLIFGLPVLALRNSPLRPEPIAT